MSKQANPRLVGAFVVVGVLLAFVIVALIGSLRALRARQTFVIYFPSSVSNLNVGAKVKWKGVPVGQVSDIRIRWNQDALSNEIPVFVSIELDRLGMDLDNPKVLQKEIANGMRARMDVESLISGMMYIELNYVQNAPPPQYFQKEHLYPELPASPSPFDAIGDVAFEIADNFRQFDFRRVSDNLNASLERANRLMDDIDAAGISRSVKSAANTVTSLAASPQVTTLLEDAAKTMRNLQELTAKLEKTADPLPGQVDALSAELARTMASVREAADSLKAGMSDNSRTMMSLDAALRELAAAARAARELTGFLERNPSALIGGRQNPETGK